jgi:hypothetical protein
MMVKLSQPVLEFIDLVFAKTSLKRSFSMTEKERSGLVFAKSGSIHTGTGEGGGRGVRPLPFAHPFHPFYHHEQIVLSAPADRADTLPLFLL